MSNDQPNTCPPTRKPYQKMMIEKVNLRTSETMGTTCQRLSSSSNSGNPAPACVVTIGTPCNLTTG
jgi:hypothetical protein